MVPEIRSTTDRTFLTFWEKAADHKCCKPTQSRDRFRLALYTGGFLYDSITHYKAS